MNENIVEFGSRREEKFLVILHIRVSFCPFQHNNKVRKKTG